MFTDVHTITTSRSIHMKIIKNIKYLWFFAPTQLFIQGQWSVLESLEYINNKSSKSIEILIRIFIIVISFFSLSHLFHYDHRPWCSTCKSHSDVISGVWWYGIQGKHLRSHGAWSLQVSWVWFSELDCRVIQAMRKEKR